MKIDIVSVFPEYFEVLNLSLFGKAQAKGLIDVSAHNLRDWTHDVHHSVDDTPVGGGAGMVMKPEVWAECLDELLGLPAAKSTAADDGGADGSPSATRPSCPTPGICCSVAGATRGTTHASPSITARKASMCASTRSAITCSTAAKWPYR